MRLSAVMTTLPLTGTCLLRNMQYNYVSYKSNYNYTPPIGHTNGQPTSKFLPPPLNQALHIAFGNNTIVFVSICSIM